MVVLFVFGGFISNMWLVCFFIGRLCFRCIMSILSWFFSVDIVCLIVVRFICLVSSFWFLVSSLLCCCVVLLLLSWLWFFVVEVF